MGIKTAIQWCDHTFNPWRGCQQVSVGCYHCYAETMAKRNPSVLGQWGQGARRVIASERSWKEPLAWNRAATRQRVRRRVFCGSMMDVLELREDLEGPRMRLLRLIVETPSLDWLLLTKRPQNYCEATRLGYQDGLPPNLWFGTSCETQAMANLRIPWLVKIPANRFLSLEPLLELIDLGPLLRATSPGFSDEDPEKPIVVPTKRGQLIDWAIFGGESGRGARPCDVAWIRAGVTDCRRVGIPAFVKQFGTFPVDGFGCMGTVPVEAYPPVKFKDPKGGDWLEWPQDLRVREMPKWKEA